MNDMSSKLDQIRKVFDTEKITNLNPNNEYIQKYYLVNRFAYSLFQSKQGYIHMGISSGEKFKEEDLLESVKFVNKYISKLLKGKVLELAAGRGVNSLYLAKENPGIEFNAVDISDGQLKYAYKNAKAVQNLKVFKGDYHNLERFEDNSFDICFIVEALCYSTDKAKVLSEVSRILKPNGLFIIIDGYLNKEEEKLNEEELLANRLVEIGMAVSKFESYSSFINSAKKGYVVEYEEDISKKVLPSMYRLERYARIFFKFPTLAKLLTHILPPIFTYNSISGYLMPSLIEDGIANYIITVLRKK